MTAQGLCLRGSSGDDGGVWEEGGMCGYVGVRMWVLRRVDDSSE